MNKRNEIKWQPFNAVIPSSVVIQELKEQRERQVMPSLSEDEKALLDAQIKKAYHTQEKIQILYFWNQHFFKKIGIIQHLDSVVQKIFFQDGTSIYFEQILKVQIL